MPAKWTERDLVNYLLGRLSGSKREELEQDYLADAGVFERLETVEDSLVNRYVTGKLSWFEGLRFRKYYLTAPAHRERVEFADRIMQALAVEPAPRPEAHLRLVWATSLAVILLAATGVVSALHWRTSRDLEVLKEELARVQSETAELVKSSAARAIPQPAVTTFLIEPVNRDVLKEEQHLEIPAVSESVELQAIVSPDLSQSYTATVTRLGDTGGQVAGLQVVREGKLVRITIPARLLLRGTYLVRVRSQDSGFEQTYQFSAGPARTR